MDAITEETPLAPEAPQDSHRRRRGASPLVSALRSIAPDERHAAISAVLREIEEEERRYRWGRDCLHKAEMPDLTRRTFDWDRTSLLREMSREEDRVIFCVMSFSPRRAPGDSLSATNPSRRRAQPSSSL
jgi:hypothetical protein